MQLKVYRSDSGGSCLRSLDEGGDPLVPCGVGQICLGCNYTQRTA